MNEEERSKLKLNIIISVIGIIIGLFCYLLEIFVLKMSGIFWLILLIVNIIILVVNAYEYKK